MKKAIIIGFCLLANLPFIVKAQSSLGIDTTAGSYQYNSTTSFNSIEIYVVSVKNYGPQPYNGVVYLEYAVDTTNIGGSLDSLTTDSFFVNNLGTFATYPDSTSLIIDVLKFKSGINTVVIWPRMGSTPFTTYDSLKLQVLVMGYAGISENNLAIKQELFPNPANQLLFVLNKDPKFIIEQVRILDSESKLIRAENFNGKLDVGGLPAGLYFIEFTSALGKTTRYKLIKE